MGSADLLPSQSSRLPGRRPVAVRPIQTRPDPTADPLPAAISEHAPTAAMSQPRPTSPNRRQPMPAIDSALLGAGTARPIAAGARQPSGRSA